MPILFVVVVGAACGIGVGRITGDRFSLAGGMAGGALGLLVSYFFGKMRGRVERKREGREEIYAVRLHLPGVDRSFHRCDGCGAGFVVEARTMVASFRSNDDKEQTFCVCCIASINETTSNILPMPPPGYDKEGHRINADAPGQTLRRKLQLRKRGRQGQIGKLLELRAQISGTPVTKSAILLREEASLLREEARPIRTPAARGPDASDLMEKMGQAMFAVFIRSTPRADCSPRFRQNRGIALDWLGVHDPSEVTELHIQRIGRAYAAYVAEGDGPTEELTALYRENPPQNTSEAAQELDSRIRHVFDALLASDEEIAAWAPHRPRRVDHLTSQGTKDAKIDVEEPILLLRPRTTEVVVRPDSVVQVLERLERGPLSEVDQQLLRTCAITLAEVKWPNLEAPYCPRCRGEQISATDATNHVLRCLRHSARLRYERLSRVAARLSAQRGQPNEFEPASPLVFPAPESEQEVTRTPFDEAVTQLGRTRPSDADRHSAAWSVRVELRWRLHVSDRTTDPCPWCAGVFPLEEFREHLWGCEKHPGAVRSAVLVDALEERHGLPALASALDEDRLLQARETAAQMVQACRVYASSLGYEDGDTYYSKVWSERPWRTTMNLADSFAQDEQLEPCSPALTQVLAIIATLANQSLTFWNGMRDGDRGRSLITADRCRNWEAQVSAAEATLSA